MANLHQIVTTGYKDLAKRGLKLIDQIKFPKELNRVHIEGKLTLDYVEHLKKGLKSLKKNSAYNHELIFHVNEGIDGTLEFIKKSGFSCFCPSK